MKQHPLSVALLTDAFVTESGEVVDGVANTLHRLAVQCRTRADRIALTVFTHATGNDAVERLGPVEIRRYRPLWPLLVHPGWAMDALPHRPRVIRDLARLRPGLLHIATPGSLGLTGLAAARRLGVPIVASYHTAYEENVRRRVEKALRRRRLPQRTIGRLFDGLTWRYVTWFLDHAELVVAPSEWTRSALARRIRTPVGLFSRGVDTDRFHPRHRREPGRTTALHVGRLVVDKNLEVLVDLFRGRRDVDLVIVGDGPERAWLEPALPRARFTGHLTGEALSVEYASADLFVFPSETETFGNVALEAMASGLPVVTSDRMAPRELITEGVNGFVGTVGVDFHLKVERLIRDAGLRRRMGAAARRFALTRRWEGVFDGLLGDYHRVVEGSAESAGRVCRSTAARPSLEAN